MVKPESHFFPMSSVKPREVSPGMWEQVLSRDPETGNVTKIFTQSPAATPYDTKVHDHGHWEEIFLLSGSMYDKTLKRWCYAGDYAVRAPHMAHGPFEAGPEGVSMIVFNTFNWKDDPTAQGKTPEERVKSGLPSKETLTLLAGPKYLDRNGAGAA